MCRFWYWPIKVLSDSSRSLVQALCFFVFSGHYSPGDDVPSYVLSYASRGHLSFTCLRAERHRASKEISARAAHCMMIGGANAHVSDSRSCDPSASYSREEGSPDSMNTGTLSMSVSTIGNCCQCRLSHSATCCDIRALSTMEPSWLFLFRVFSQLSLRM